MFMSSHTKSQKGSKSSHKDSKKASSRGVQHLTKAVVTRLTLPLALQMVKPLLSRRSALSKVSDDLKLMTASAVSQLVDSKSTLSESLKSVDQSIQMIRSSLASAYGRKPVPFRLPLSFSQTCAAGSGILAAVTPIDATLATEYATLAALFDEYKVTKGVVDYVVSTQTDQANASNALNVTVYNPIEGTALTSVRNGCEDEQHQLVGTSAPGSGSSLCFTKSSGVPYRFRFHIPEGVTMNVNTGVVVTFEGGYYPTISTSNVVYWGYLKSYQSTGFAVATVIKYGIIYLDVLYRCRD